MDCLPCKNAEATPELVPYLSKSFSVNPTRLGVAGLAGLAGWAGWTWRRWKLLWSAISSESERRSSIFLRLLGLPVLWGLAVLWGLLRRGAGASFRNFMNCRAKRFFFARADTVPQVNLHRSLSFVCLVPALGWGCVCSPSFVRRRWKVGLPPPSAIARKPMDREPL